MSNPVKFKISDGSENSYGFSVQTSGIDMSAFLKNPVGFYNHDREKGVIIKWTDLEVKPDETGVLCLYGTPVFDTNDPLGAEIARKVEEGFLKGCSIGISDIEVQEITAVPGEDCEMVVIGCKLYEISIVDIPSNSNSVRLYENQNGEMTLCEEGKIKTLFNQFKNKTIIKEDMKNLGKLIMLFATAGVSLKADATEEDVCAEVEKLIKTNAALKEEHRKMAEKEKELKTKQIATLSARCNGDARMSEVFKESVKTVAESNYELAVKMVDDFVNQNTKPTRPSDVIQQQSAPASAELTFEKLLQNPEELKRLRSEEPAKYAALYKARYGVSPVV